MDFATASETVNFVDKGTCVETVTKDILDDFGAITSSWDCVSNNEKYSRLVMSQAHSIQYIASTQSSSVLNKVSTSMKNSLLGRSSDAILPSMADEVMRMLDEDGVVIPATCSEIYSNYTNVSLYYDTSVATLPNVTCAHGNEALNHELGMAESAWFSNDDWRHLLHACEKQFHFGRSGPHEDTYGIPLLNQPPLQFFMEGGLVKGIINKTAPWSVKSRMSLGVRFGASLFPYSATVASLSFMTMGSFFVLAYDTYLAWKGTPEDRLKDVYVVMKGYLWILSSVSVVFSFFFFGIYYNWQFEGAPQRYPRPICEESANRMWPMFSHKKSNGGWKSNLEAFELETWAFGCDVVTFILITIRLPLEGYDTGDLTEFKTRVSCSKEAITSMMLLSLLGFLLMVLGTSLPGIRFGEAWLESLERDDLPWSAGSIALPIYNMNMAGFVASIMFASIVASVISRRYAWDKVKESVAAGLLWVGITSAVYGLFFVVYNVTFFTDEEETTKDCKIFDAQPNATVKYNEDYEGSCALRLGLYAGSIIVSLIAVFGSLILEFLARNPRNPRDKVEPKENADTNGSNNSATRCDESINLLNVQHFPSPTHPPPRFFSNDLMKMRPRY